MNIDQIEQSIKNLAIFEETFVYDFLLAYGMPKATITLLEKGNYNSSKEDNEVFLAKKLFFKSDTQSKQDIHITIDTLKNRADIKKKKPQFIIVTDFQTLLAIDTKNNDSLDIPINDLPSKFDFFLPLAGLKKEKREGENPADIKAAERLGKLYDLLLEDNPTEKEEDRHKLNMFLSRLLFCFFAEATEIFSKNQVTNAMASHTNPDGSNLTLYLEKLFKVLNKKKRANLPDYLKAFPYVNGGLFEKELPVPKLSKKSRSMILQSGDLNWAEINPDIFGSMIQAVVHHSKRGNLGMHYTSVENIMKVINPLFLDELIETFQNIAHKERKTKDAQNKQKKELKDLLDRIYNIKIFDPACGSGNFLIIAFKQLCKLEIEIFKKIYGEQTSFKSVLGGNIQLHQFYGIEIDDFAHETAKLSLWLAEHQMNIKFKDIFGTVRATLPLSEGGNIVCGNATRLNWQNICPKNQNDEIYILGNPPFAGSTGQNKKQKKDLEDIAKGQLGGYKKLDYIACWFIKAAKYIKLSENSFCGFVSTNSICQGLQASLLWPYLFKKDMEIHFAHRSFKWKNNAKGEANVSCVIIGLQYNLQKKNRRKKNLYEKNILKTVDNINAYLIPGKNFCISKQTISISGLEKMESGNRLVYAQYLFLTNSEKIDLIASTPSAKEYIKRVYGSSEFINGGTKWCLWINDKNLHTALTIPEIKKRIEKTKTLRETTENTEAKRLAKTPHRFNGMKGGEKLLIVPKVSSITRLYIPIGFLNEQTIISDLAFAIYKPTLYTFSIISSQMHMTWVRTVASRFNTDYRYSPTLCYNTFPFPKLPDPAKETLNKSTLNILSAREQFPEKTLAELYDPDKMPEVLQIAHIENDSLIEQCYQTLPFHSDEERLSVLFKLYEKMINKENLKKEKNAKKK